MEQPFTVDFEPEPERPPVVEFDRQPLSLEDRILQLEHDFAEAVDLAEEAIPYVSEYLAAKWDMPERLARLKGKIDPKSDAYMDFWFSDPGVPV